MVITAVVEKEKGAKLGLKLTSEGDKLMVTKIAEGGAMAEANTDLRVGMEVLSINGESVAGMSSSDAAKKMLDSDGSVTLTARYPLNNAFVVGTFNKDGPTTKVGLRLEEGEGVVMINSIREETLAATTDLDGGMAIRLINNVNCVGKDAMFVAQLLADAVGYVTVAAEVPTIVTGELADKELITATVQKEEGAKLGLTLTEVDGNRLIVTKVKEGGLVATQTDLDVGMEIYSINNILVSGKSSTEAAGILIDAEGTITILAFKADTNGDQEEEEEPKSSAAPAVAAAAAATTAAAAATAASMAVEDEPAVEVELEDEEPAGEPAAEPEPAPAPAPVAAPAAVAAASIPRASTRSTQAPGTLTIGHISKGPGQKIGFRLGLKDGKVMVSGIGDGSLAATTPIEPGMVLLQINGNSCEGKDTSDIAKMLGDAGDNIVIVAETPGPGPTPQNLVAAVVEKEQGSKVGVTLTQQDKKLMITKIKEDGLLAKTQLKVGMEILAIDNVNCVGKGSPEAAALFQKVEGKLVVLARKVPMAPGELVTAALSKDTPGAKLGIRLGMAGGTVVVSSLADGSLAAMTDIEPGMAIRSINNVDVAGMESSDAANLLKEASGIITILAETRTAGGGTGADVGSLVAASVHNTEGANLGITLSQEGGKLTITSIDKDGLFFGTALRVGMQVLKINNVDCSVLSKEAADLLLGKEGTITVLAKRKVMAPGSLMTVVIKKDDPDVKVGLGLGSSNGHIVVTKIKDGTLSAMTDLQPGMVLRTINNTSCNGLDSVGVARLLADAEGTITIVAEVMKSKSAPATPPKYFTATVEKEEGAKAGVALTQSGGKLVVTKIREDGLLAETGLEVGMEVVMINNVDCSKKSTEDAAAMLQNTQGQLTILAKKPPPAPGSLITASVVKESVDSKVGLKLGVSNGTVVVAGVKEESLVATTELETGMVIKSINNTDCTGLEATQAAALLTEAEGILTILAEVPKGRDGGAGAAVISSLITATAMKEKEGSAGVVLERQQGKLLVGKIEEEGALFGTGLRLGMEVVAINNVDTSVLSEASANELLNKEGYLTLLAKPVSLPPGTLITAAFNKPTQDTKVGVRLGMSNGVVVITNVSDGTAAATSTLEPGMVIRAINNVDCTKRSSDVAAKLLKEAIGTVTVLAEKPTREGVNLKLPVTSLFTITVKKEKDQKVGVTLTNETGKLTVGTIKDDSIFAKTRLKAGMEVMKVNNVDCTGMSPSEAAKLLTESEGRLTLLGKKASAAPGTMITATVTKESVDSKVGIGMGTLGGSTVITNIKDDSLAVATDLEVGMALRTINNVDCTEIDATEAAKILKEAEGKVMIVAEVPTTSKVPSLDSLITASIDKSKGDKVGMAVAAKGGQIFISKIASDGLIAGTGMEVGMELLSINNTACAGMSSPDAANLLTEADGELTLLARKAALPPGTFVTAVVFKESAATKVGLRLGSVGGLVTISSIGEDSLVSGTDLKPGMVLRTINNVDCTRMEPTDAAKLLMEAEGALSILAETPMEQGVKADAPALSKFVTVTVSSKAGDNIGLKLTRDSGKLEVSEISEDGSVMGTSLRVGMEVVKINNIDCGILSPAAATELLTSGETLTILARKPVLVPGTLVTAVIQKNDPETKLGLKMGLSKNKVIVTGVKDGSPAATTSLESGMVIKSINNIICANKDGAGVSKLLGDAVGLVTILAEVPSETGEAAAPSLVTASADKSSGAESGVTFSEEGEAIKVASISKDGIWSKTRLRNGMEVLSINGIQCNGKSAADIESALADMEGKVTILAKAQSFAPGTLVTAAMVKTANEKVGLGIGTLQGKPVITTIKNDTLSAPTDLQTGMIVRLVNNTDCSQLESTQVAKLLGEADGPLTIVAEVPRGTGDETPDASTPVTATVFKEKDAKAGLALTDTKSGKVYISRIKEDGLLASSDLRVGMEVISIDNHTCEGKTSVECSNILKDTEGYLTILARNPVLPPGSFVTAVITKESVDSKVGLRLGTADGVVVVSSITEGSLAYYSELEPGMIIRSINNVECAGLTNADAAKLLIDAEGNLTILASTPTKGASDTADMTGVCAVSFEKSSDDELGMKLDRKSSYPVVTEILAKGVVFGTALRVGMEILKINNADCAVLTADAANQLLEKGGKVTVLAKKKAIPPGHLVTAVLYKESPEVKVGLGMGSKNGKIYVTKIRDGALAALTELQPGMIVRTIDNVDLAGSSLVEAANMLANAEGKVTVAAEMPGGEVLDSMPKLITASVYKEKDAKAGLSLSQKKDILFVSQIAPDSIFVGTGLKVGVEVLAINNIQCKGLPVSNAAEILKETEGDLTIVAKIPILTPGSLVTASIVKANVASKVGIKVGQQNGVVVIKNIKPESLASQTELKENMVIKSINNVSCQGLEPTAAAKLLTDAQGTITIVAEIPTSKELSAPASTLLTVACTIDESSKAGLTVTKKNAKTVVTDIEEDGLMYGSGIRMGMEILKINNVDCSVLSALAIHRLLATPGELTILARKTLKRAGILVAATFKKPTIDAKAGLGLGAAKGRIIVTKIGDGTPCSRTEIQKGMIVRQINEEFCDDKSPTDAAKILASAEGLVTVLLETPDAKDEIGSPTLIKSLATAAVDKDEDGELGVTFTVKGGKLVVLKVTEEGLFATSGLRPGMAMLSINNVNCSRRTPEEAMTMLEEAKGCVTVLAQKPFLGPGEIITATISRPDTSVKLGLGLGASTKSGKVVITSVKKGSKCWLTELYSGMVVRSINNQELKGKTPEEAAKILADATGMFTIAAESVLDEALVRQNKTGLVQKTITATIKKEKGSKVGLLLGEKGKKLYVSKINPDGLMASTDLKVGMLVVSINNVDCSNIAVADAAKILVEAEGDVTILARQPDLNPGALITVSITKDKPDSPLGVGLGYVNNKVVVSSIKYGALASKTELQVGMAIKNVNNVDCSRKQPTDVAKLLADAESTVLILAEVSYPSPKMVGGSATSKGKLVYDNSARPPPYGIADGGIWVKRKYAGKDTMTFTALGCAMFLVPGAVALMNPVDVRDVYILNGTAYKADGTILGVATSDN